MYQTDAIIVGAGVIGLAVARALSLRGLDTIVLEAESAIGTHTSSRNSEVIHAGIYYPQGSLKAAFCVEGRRQLYAFCETRKVPFRRCGKLIVAADAADTGELERLLSAGRRNGVDDLAEIDRSRALELEPEIRCAAALYSPSTGIVDSHALMLALQGEAEDHGARIALRAPFLRAEPRRGGFAVSVGGDEPLELETRLLVNAAGLFATQVAEGIAGLPAEHLRRTRWAKGNYFTLACRPPFRHLVYPVPEPGGLGVHVTLDLGGQARFGPDVEWVDRIDYALDDSRRARFGHAIERYWPGLRPEDLQPGYAGIRPKLSGPGEPAADFALDGPSVHGIAGLMNLFGIESPGMTASLAIADAVAVALP